MGAIIDLWKSERGLVAIALIAATFVLTLTGQLSADKWIEHSTWIFATYVAGKTVSSVAEARASSAGTTKPDMPVAA